MASTFNRDIYQVVTTALSELTEAQASGRVPRTPLSEAHFLGRWITQALKLHRFSRTTVEQLKAWQQQSRSRGKGAELTPLFRQIQAWYGALLTVDDGGTAMAPVQKPQLAALLEEMVTLDWQVETTYPVRGPCHHHSEGRSSLVVCADALSSAFEGEGTLAVPLSLYARGEVSVLIARAYQQGLLLHKVSDYRALVKYHGEYRLYPDNAGPMLAELPALIA
ncbi:DUF2913 family protein [Ferrimonas gelatinilytica]|uniref:DUF2913 family protein n=1 Tax=Ferrimonas gelatinilytica TaxID=1255257 RepID=A0ABP9S784_9GAMM